MTLPKSRPGFPAKMPSTAHVKSAPVKSTQAKSGAIKNAAAPAIFQRATAQKNVISSGIGLDSHAMRQRMVDKLAAQGISDAALLHAMNTVERHRFVDTALVGQAYEDTSLPIGLGQTISKPNVVARMIELLRQGCAKDSKGRIGRVLEIGTGCGYQAALLAQVCSEVYSIERLRGLHDKARDNLRPFAIAHLHLLLGDGMLGYAKGGPFAGIIAAAGGDAIPQAWVDQLAVGGRLVAPVVTTGAAQALIVLDKTQQGVTQSVLEAVHFVPLKSGVI
jgi:protein-L-isoaspartate(D-aspartate) O-methyltransferase